MTKFQDLKKAISNPPPDRIAKVEYQSHFLQILGILFVTGMLIYKGFWYIIFAFIFGVGVSYSQGITAYQKYNVIRSIVRNDYKLEEEKSPSRKRDHIIRDVFGGTPWWFSIIISLIITYFIIGIGSWYKNLSFVFFAIFFQLIIYFFLIYHISKPFHKPKKNKEVKDDE